MGPLWILNITPGPKTSKEIQLDLKAWEEFSLTKFSVYQSYWNDSMILWTPLALWRWLPHEAVVGGTLIYYSQVETQGFSLVLQDCGKNDFQ